MFIKNKKYIKITQIGVIAISLYEKAVEVILDALKRYVDDAISKAHFDRTVRGIVVSVDGNVYTVKVGKEIYHIKSTDAYAIGNTVYVLMIQNDPNNKIIIGKVV